MAPVYAPEGAAGGNVADINRFQRNRTEGFVVECDGERAVIAATAGRSVTASEDYWAVGQLISVRVGENRVVGLIYRVDTVEEGWDRDGDNSVHIHIELAGEIAADDSGSARFSGGISAYPHAGAIAHRIRSADLAAIYAAGQEKMVPIGTLTQDPTIPALISIDKLLSRHFAVVGTTGVGKSTAVTLLLRKVIAERRDVRVLLFDPHNEFGAAFPNEALVLDASTVELPFWLFRLDELVEVIFRGRPGDPTEVDALRDLIPAARERFMRGDAAPQLLRRERSTSGITADTPLPYRMADLLALLDERIGQLEGKADKPALKALKNRLASIITDPRFRFMFGAKAVVDVYEAVVSKIFRIPVDNRPICVFEMSGLPSEVVNAVVSVLCRISFDLAVASDGGIQTLVVCEEAHRYIPADQNAGFWPTRQAIARIAKEGRKYGVYLGVITQRPGELDATILSQCNTVFAMRLGNERDQEIIRKAISGAARSTLSFLSSISNGECIAFGEAIHAPMRMKFERIARTALPGSHIYDRQDQVRAGDSVGALSAVIRRIRFGEEPDGTEDDVAAEVGSWGQGTETPAPPRAPLPHQETPRTLREPDPYQDYGGARAGFSGRFATTPPTAHRAEPAAGATDRDRVRGNDLVRAFRPRQP